MADLNDFSKFAKLFEEHVKEHNDMTIDENIRTTRTDKIAAAYKNVKASMDNLLNRYLDIGKKQKEIADTFVQVLMYMVYQTSLSQSFAEYKALSEFIMTLFDENSELMKLLKLIEEKLIIFNSLHEDDFDNPTSETLLSSKYNEWVRVKAELKELLDKLFALLKKILVALGILPEDFEIEYEDVEVAEGEPARKEMKIKAKGVRSFGKRFAQYEKHFNAYLGTINRTGYVGQKAKVYMQMPLVGSQHTRALEGGKPVLNVSIPLMDISNINFINDPKNIIFGIFNIRDYTGKVLVENEDDEQESAYIYKDSYIRFGGLFSAKDIDMNAGTQSFRLNYNDSGWTSGKIKKKGMFNIDNVSIKCKFGDKEYYDESNIGSYPAETKLCDKIEFYEEISSLTDNEVYKFTGELSYDEDYSNQKNNEEATLQENLNKKNDEGRKATYLAPTVDVETKTIELKDSNGNVTGTETYYVFTIDGVDTGVKTSQLASAAKLDTDPFKEAIEGGVAYTMPKTSSYESGGKTYYSLVYRPSFFKMGVVKTTLPTEHTKSLKSYFKGTLKLESLTTTEDESSSTGFMSDYTASKEVIMEFCPVSYSQNGTTESGTFDVKCYLDPDSQSNANYSEDNENSPTVFLPPIVSNFEMKGLNLSGDINITSSELEAAEALLGISQIDMDNFDELDYASLLDKLNNAKNQLIGSLLGKISDLNSLITTIITAGSLFQAYDNIYCGDYIEDITTSYSELQNVFQTYLSTSTYDIAELYNGVFAAKVDKGIIKIDNTIGGIIDDVIASESIYHNYENKLSYLVNAPKTGISFDGPLSCVYDVLSGSSTTIATMNASGQTVKTYHIEYSYTDWLNMYITIPYGKGESKNYFTETYLLQYLYVITQLYKHFSAGNEEQIKKVNYFLRILLLRLMMDNVYNSYFDSVYNQSKKYNVKSILLNYADTIEHVECADLDFNTYFLNPFIVDCFPHLDKFNRYNINDTDQLSRTNLSKLCRSLLYKSLLDIPSEFINIRMQQVYDFLNNGQKLNIRELIFKYNFYLVLNDLNTSISDSRYHIDISNYSQQIKELERKINSIVNYRLLLEDSTGNPISKLMTIESDKPVTASTEEKNPLIEVLTFPKLLINNYTYKQAESTTTPEFIDIPAIATAKKMTAVAKHKNLTITKLM